MCPFSAAISAHKHLLPPAWARCRRPCRLAVARWTCWWWWVVVVEPSWKNFLDKSGTRGSNLQALVEGPRDIFTVIKCKWRRLSQLLPCMWTQVKESTYLEPSGCPTHLANGPEMKVWTLFSLLNMGLPDQLPSTLLPIGFCSRRMDHRRQRNAPDQLPSTLLPIGFCSRRMDHRRQRNAPDQLPSTLLPIGFCSGRMDHRRERNAPDQLPSTLLPIGFCSRRMDHWRSLKV